MQNEKKESLAKTLRSFGFSQPPWAMSGGTATALVVGPASLGAGVYTGLKMSVARPNFAEAIPALIGLVAFFFGYLQWRAGRHEVSMDKYYERLEIANHRLAVLAPTNTTCWSSPSWTTWNAWSKNTSWATSARSRRTAA